jgi:hypothetical protein
MPDFDQLKVFLRVLNNPDSRNIEYENAAAEIRKAGLNPGLLEGTDPDSHEFERLVRGAPIAEEGAEIETPVTESNEDKDGQADEFIPDSDYPGYATNWDGTVRSLPGPRRKDKRLRPYSAWGKTRKGQYYVWSYFTLYKDGARHKVTQAQMLMNRQRTVWERSGKGRKASSVPI